MSVTWETVSRNISTLVAERDGEWCGMPMPIERYTLVIEDKNPWKCRIAELEGSMYPVVAEEEESEDTIVNQWYSQRLRANVVIAKKADGTYFSVIIGHDFGIKFKAVLGTIAASEVWSIKAERTAQAALAGLVKPHMLDMYGLTGMILETSKRSGVTYVFRRSRPTLALRPTKDGQMSLLCALCLHPIGYYQSTFAGSMVPTDELIAHLLLMRADEPMYWRRSNQHPVWSPLAGV